MVPQSDLANTVSGSTTLGQMLQQLAKNPQATQLAKQALIKSGETAAAGGIASQIIDNLLTGSLQQFSYANSMANNPQPKAVPNSGNATLSGQTVDTQGDQLINTSGGTISGYGTLRTAGFQNLGTVKLSAGSSYVSGPVSNLAHFNISDSTVAFQGNVKNTGTMNVNNSVVTYKGSFTNNGGYRDSPSKNYFHDVSIGSQGYMTGEKGSLFSVAGDFINHSTQNALWQTSLATLAFTGSGAHEFDLAGKDLGATILGYKNNFSWGVLDLTGLSGSLALDSGNANFADAFYVGDLLGANFVNDMATNIFGNGLNVYYLAYDPQNDYLGGLRYALSGGGFLIPVTQEASSVPAPGTLWLVLISAPPLMWALRLRGQKLRHSSNRRPGRPGLR
ncbi:MAG: hypothetical protein B7Z74_05265 [Deltaproteobacteria bacterium 21-66-5]|nr:MAG: hypothetical protein B7Z74_05265 [Deltaproteobacteria bacterium 21-66-5]